MLVSFRTTLRVAHCVTCGFDACGGGCVFTTPRGGVEKMRLDTLVSTVIIVPVWHVNDNCPSKPYLLMK